MGTERKRKMTAPSTKPKTIVHTGDVWTHTTRGYDVRVTRTGNAVVAQREDDLQSAEWSNKEFLRFFRPKAARQPWYLAVVWHGDGPLTAEHYLKASTSAHMGDEWPDPPPTYDEMQHVMHAAKMELWRQLRRRKPVSGRSR